MDRSFQEVKWLKWVQTLPDTLIRTRPVLSAGYGWALLDTGQFEEAEPRLQNAESWLENPTGDMVVVDQREYEALPATIAAGRAYLAMGRGDLTATKRYAQLTLDLLQGRLQRRVLLQNRVDRCSRRLSTAASARSPAARIGHRHVRHRATALAIARLNRSRFGTGGRLGCRPVGAPTGRPCALLGHAIIHLVLFRRDHPDELPLL